MSTLSPAMKRLIELIRLRRNNGEEPYVLILGNGASISSGVPPWEQIIDEIIREYGSGQVTTREEKLTEFYGEMLASFSELDRVLVLQKHVAGKRPSKGYGCLATLAKNDFFRVIFSTNVDPYLEDSFMNIGLRTEDFTKLIVGVHKEEQISNGLRYQRPKIKIVKLHGDLAERRIAITPEETYQFDKEIEDILKTYFTQNDVIIFGHSMRDIDIIRCIEKKGGSIWYVNPSKPKPDDLIMQAMVARRSAQNIINGDEAKFDNFFCILTDEFDLPLPKVDVSGASAPDAHLIIKEQYQLRRVTIPYLTWEGFQRGVDCNIKETSPTNIRDFKDYVKLKVHVEFGRCPRCTEPENAPINHWFEVGLSDKFTGFDPITCKKGHTFFVSKRLTWMLDRTG